MAAKKKILVIGPGMELGGVERSLVGLLDAFDYSQVEVDLFLFRHTGEMMSHINGNVTLLPQSQLVSYCFWPCRELFLHGHWFALLLRGIAYFGGKYNRKKLKQGDDSKDIYHRMVAHLVKKNPKNYDLALGFIDPHYYLLNCVQAKTKIGWMHTDWATIGRRSGVKINARMWTPLDYIACVSQGVKESFDKVFPQLAEKSIVVENVLPQSYVRKQAEEFVPEKEMPSGKFNILSVGRFSSQKNFLNAIRCARKLHDEGVDFRWYFIGYGPLEEKMRALMTDLDAGEYVRILGKKANPYPYMKKCDLYAQPSNFEGKAVTVREAQMLAKPVLITNYATASSQLEDGQDGHICELSMEGICDGVRFMMEHPEYRSMLSKNTRKNDYSGAEEAHRLEKFAVDTK